MKKILSALLCAVLIMSLSVVYVSAETENVSAGLTSYTINGLLTDADGKLWYPDENGNSLTNNVFAQSAGYGDMEFIGLNSTSEFGKSNGGITTIVLDLGETYPIVTATVSCSNFGEAGINLPKAVTVTVSNDGENWSEPIAAEYEVDEPVVGEVIKAIAKVNTEARYITYHFEHASNWVFIDEIQAFAGDISGENTTDPEESKEQTESEEESKNNTAEKSDPAENSTDNNTDNKGGNTDWIYIVCAVAAVAAFIITVIIKKKK